MTPKGVGTLLMCVGALNALIGTMLAIQIPSGQGAIPVLTVTAGPCCCFP
jgi:hypothetical protein